MAFIHQEVLTGAKGTGGVDLGIIVGFRVEGFTQSMGVICRDCYKPPLLHYPLSTSKMRVSHRVSLACISPSRMFLR